MSQLWKSSEQEDRYVDDPSFIEGCFGVRPLSELLARDVIGIARLIVMPSFCGESIYTLIYHSSELLLQSAVAEHSLWSSLHGGRWSPPRHVERRLSLRSLSSPLRQWSEMKTASLAAPSIKISVIDGREYATRDGVHCRHSILDENEAFHAEWWNPIPEASNHVAQMVLVRAYESLIKKEAHTET